MPPTRWPRISLLALLALAVSLVACSRGPEPLPDLSGWERLEPGLSLGSFPISPSAGEPPGFVRILRIHPEHFELRLENASAGAKQPLTARAWCRSTGMIAAINAGMYQEDYLTSVSLMRTRNHVNNPRLTRHRSVLAFDRLDTDAPRVKIIDLECEEFEHWKDRYGTLVQSIRMLSCDGENVWEQQPRRWSTSAIGLDRQGRVLFIHVRAHLSTHDLINALVELPLELASLMYAEGGPEAQLFVDAGERDHEFVGSHDPSPSADDPPAWPVPNVVGVVRRDSPAASAP